jgi:hypothetical protein
MASILPLCGDCFEIGRPSRVGGDGYHLDPAYQAVTLAFQYCRAFFSELYRSCFVPKPQWEKRQGKPRTMRYELSDDEWTAINPMLPVQMIDTSVVRVHQHGACITDNNQQDMGRSRDGLTGKIHVVVDPVAASSNRST